MLQHNEPKVIDIKQFNQQCELLQSPSSIERQEASKYINKCASNVRQIEEWTRLICKCNNNQSAFTCLQILLDKIRCKYTQINTETSQKIKEDLYQYITDNKEDYIPP
eukprot:242585_1